MNHPTVQELASAGTMPSNQVLGMVEEAAYWALDRIIDHTDAYALVTAQLIRLGYRPADDGADHWQTLLKYLTDFARWNDTGPDWSEQRMTENTWLRMIRDELVAVAGRPS